MRNFVLSEAKAGKPVITASGNPARIICYDASGPFPLIALVVENNDEVLHIYTKEGKYNLAGGSFLDLMMQDDVYNESLAKQERWIDNEDRKISGFYVNTHSEIREAYNLECHPDNYNVFATERQAQSALALAQLTQIIANDPRFGGPITDEEWSNSACTKYVIRRCDIGFAIKVYTTLSLFSLLAFRTEEQALLFCKENHSLLKEYFMM